MMERSERERKPRNGRYYKQPQYSPTSTESGISGSPPYVNGRSNGISSANGNSYKPSYSPTPTDGGSVSPQPTNGWDFTELEVRYTGMINSLKDELSFLEESNGNLLTELRESQDSNYVLTEELRRQQRNNLNTLDELHACQTANSVLRQELQRLEQASVKMTRESEKFKKANSMLKDEIKDYKMHHNKRRNSMVTLKEKAKDLQKDIMEKEKDYKELSSLKHTVNIIVEAVENDSNIENGYCPTDSDSASMDGNDERLGAFTPKPVKKSDNLPSPLARKFFSAHPGRSPVLRRKPDSLFGKRTKDLYADTERLRSRSLIMTTTNNSGGSRDQSPSPPNAPPVNLKQSASGRRGSLDSFNNKEIQKETSSLRSDALTRLLGKSLERLTDHNVRRSNSSLSSQQRPRSMTIDMIDRTDDNDFHSSGMREIQKFLIYVDSHSLRFKAFLFKEYYFQIRIELRRQK